MDTEAGSTFGQLIETRLRVVTWNVWARQGPWLARQEAILRTLVEIDADIVALQEVWMEYPAHSQAAAIARDLDMVYTFRPNWREDGCDVGNAILSRWPIVEVDSTPIPAEDPDRSRSVLMAKVAGPRGPLTVYTTHLTYAPDGSRLRQRQVESVAEFVAATRSSEFPPILAGDFNAAPDSDEIRMLTGERPVPVPGLVFYDAWAFTGQSAAGYTWSNSNPYIRPRLEPERRIDYLLVGAPVAGGAGNILRARLAGAGHDGAVVPSDHYAVVTELRY